jgi:hypothetical protein
LQSARGHLELSAMRKRVEMAGGWCHLRSLPDDGTTVDFWVPDGAPRPEPPEADDDEVSLERRSEETSSIPLGVGGSAMET